MGRPTESASPPRPSLAESTTTCGPAYRRLGGLHSRRIRAPGPNRDGHLVAPRRGQPLPASPCGISPPPTWTPTRSTNWASGRVARVEAEQDGHRQAPRLRGPGGTQGGAQDRPRILCDLARAAGERAQRYIDQMEAKLPDLFGLLPAIPLDVRPVEAYREKEAAARRVLTPARRTAPGRASCTSIPATASSARIVGIEAVAYHEGVPGHHLQVARSPQTLPTCRPSASTPTTAPTPKAGRCTRSGWARTMGFYEDPHSDFGRLSNELLRAVRLVLDTGVHHKRWSREQMVDYFRAHSSEDEPDLQAEVDRYIVLPAQALTYKLGELEILRLRDRARGALGPRFDLRALPRPAAGRRRAAARRTGRTGRDVDRGAPVTILTGFELPMEEELFFEEQGGALKRPSMQEAARAALERARSWWRRRWPTTGSRCRCPNGGEAQVGGRGLPSRPATPICSGKPESVLLALVTVGPRLEAESRRLQAAGKALDAYMLDAAGVFGVGLLIHKAHRIVEQEAARTAAGEWGPSWRPGQLSGWALSEQIIDRPDARCRRHRACEVTASGMLVPQKSASLLVGHRPGLTRPPKSARPASSATCRRPAASGTRRAPALERSVRHPIRAHARRAEPSYRQASLEQQQAGDAAQRRTSRRRARPRPKDRWA